MHGMQKSGVAKIKERASFGVTFELKSLHKSLYNLLIPMEPQNKTCRAFRGMSAMYPQKLFLKSNQRCLRGQRSNDLVHETTIKTLSDEAIQYII